MDKRKCKICGKTIKINKFQKRKKICETCAYELKKTRVEAKYWSKKTPESPQAHLWEGRLAVLEKQLKR